VDTVRIDRWLCAARIFKSRSQATSACGEGRVSCNDAISKPHHALRAGDHVEVRGHRLRILDVVALADKRMSASLARELYEDHSPPPPPPEDRAPSRERGLGRPTKRDLRSLRQFRGR